MVRKNNNETLHSKYEKLIMIFQIDYMSNDKYKRYFEFNSKYNIPNHIIFNDIKINEFLNEYGYFDVFKSFKVDPVYNYAKKAILCDVLRLMILYEFGGIYVDADVFFTPEIVNIENHFNEKFQNKTILLSTRSFFFLKAEKKSKYIEKILSLYYKAELLRLDIFMLNKIEIVKYANELMVIPETHIKQFFTHDQITSKLK